MISKLCALFNHAVWADRELLRALDAAGVPRGPLRELAHVVGAMETWLARIEQRSPTLPVWPELDRTALGEAIERVHAAIAARLRALGADDMDRALPYVNSSGRRFESTIGDMLLQAALHGQYHRGKVNQMLRDTGHQPAPVDYIAFVRGAPAATTKETRRPGG